jgi:hypothetical protein
MMKKTLMRMMMVLMISTTMIATMKDRTMEQTKCQRGNKANSFVGIAVNKLVGQIKERCNVSIVTIH